MPDLSSISGIMVQLHINGETSLFILLGADGSITRVGTGTSETDRAMYIGKTDPALFQRLRQQIMPEFLGWLGKHLQEPQPRGNICELTVGLQDSDGKEWTTAFRYGSESYGPPPEVGQFVFMAVNATNPWYERQRAMGISAARQDRKRPWWRFW